MYMTSVVVFVKLDIFSVFSYKDIASRNYITPSITELVYIFIKLDTIFILSHKHINSMNYVRYSVIRK
jgi:hypothetical protein